MARTFEDLLLDYAKAKDDASRERTEQELWSRFGARRTVLVLDLSGFSLLTQRHGIVHYLSIVRRMQIASQPIIESFGGQVVKFAADNCFASFQTPLQAIQAAEGLNRCFAGMNQMTPDHQDIRVAIGIDEGLVLVLGSRTSAVPGSAAPGVDEAGGSSGWGGELDYMGNAVNRAFKLGEDLAEPGETLITRSAYELIPEASRPAGKSVNFTVSGITIDVVSLRLGSGQSPA